MDGEHPCAAPGCLKRVPADHLMCPAHWGELPDSIRAAVEKAWRNVHRDIQGYADAVEKAKAWHRANGSGRQGGLF